MRNKSALIAFVLLVAIAVVPQIAFAADGAALYKAKCQACHGPDAKKNMPDAKLDAAAVQKAIREGKPNAKPMKMPAYGPDKIDDASAQAIATFVAGLKK